MFIYNLAQKFSKIVEENSNRTAIILDKKKLTFGQLDKISDKIANYLIINKVKVGDRVCISLKKDFFTYALLIACIKIGAPYSFLDIQSPNIRIKKIINNLKPKVCIYEENKFDKEKKSKKTKFIDSDSIRKKIDKISLKKNKKNYDKINSENIAYIMFTSGSTGDPKGVTITHKNLLNFSEWCKKEYSINRKDILTNLNALHFDNSVFDIYAGLFNGSAIVPFNSIELIDAKNLIKKIKNSKSTIWFSVPSLIIYLMSFGFFKKKQILKTSLNKIIFGGEGFVKSKLKELYKNVNSKINLVNVYGPTECTCICSNYRITNFDFTKREMSRFAPFGSKLADNFKYYIIDKNSNKSAKGNIGELIIGGENVSKGYFDINNETKTNFIQNPFNKKYNEIVYKTGDLVYMDNKNSNIYFSNRSDNQIKYLGHRIELGEIEQSINKIDVVKENFVSFGKKDNIDQIVSFISHTGDIDKIKKKIYQTLPKYMIPQKFIEFSNLPKNQNGKIHRTKLKEEYFDR